MAYTIKMGALSGVTNRLAARQSGKSLLVVRNAFANLARFSSGWIIVLVTLPILVRTLSKAEYATWILILQVGSYVLMADAALTMAVARFVARFTETQELDDLSRTISSALTLVVALAIPASACVLATAYVLPHFITDTTPNVQRSAQRALILVGATYALALPSSVLAGVFVGYQKSGVNALAATMAKILGASGAVFAALRGQGIVAMAIWTAVGTMLQPILYTVCFVRLRPRPSMHVRHVTRKATAAFAAFAGTMMLTSFTGVLISGLDMPVATTFDFDHAAYYAIALTVANLLIVPFGSVTAALMPLVSGKDAGNDPHANGALVIRLSSLTNALLGLLSLGLLLAIPIGLPLWIGVENASQVEKLAVLLVLAQHIRLSLSAYALTGFSAGQQNRMLGAAIGEGVVNLTCSIFLSRKIGVVGVAYGTLLGSTISVLLHFVVSMPRTDRVLVNRGRLFLRGVILPMVCTLSFALPVVFLSTWIALRWMIPISALIFVAAVLTVTRFAIPDTMREQLFSGGLGYLRSTRLRWDG